MDNITKIMNRKAILDAFRRTQYMSSTEASEAAGQSRSTGHRAVEFLRKRDLLVVSGKGQSTDSGGKKPLLLTLNANYRHMLCFHIYVGGMTAGITDLKGRLLAENSVFFPPNSPLDLVLAHMKDSYENMSASLRLKEKDFAAVAVGCNGVVDSDTGILAGSPGFSSWGNNIPMGDLVAEMFKAPPSIFIDNANRFDAYAEYRIGQAHGLRNFITLDGHIDGLGAGVVMDGKLWRGRHRLAGEIGHIAVDPAGGVLCACGAKGCLEAIASMTALENAARSGYQRNRKSAVFSRTAPADVTYKIIYNAANAGDAFARTLVSNQAGWLAMGVNAAAMLLDPDAVILQGTFTKGGDFLIQELGRKFAELGLPGIRDKVEILCSNLGRERCLIGQAHFAADIFFESADLYE